MAGRGRRQTSRSGIRENLYIGEESLYGNEFGQIKGGRATSRRKRHHAQPVAQVFERRQEDSKIQHQRMTWEAECICS